MEALARKQTVTAFANPMCFEKSISLTRCLLRRLHVLLLMSISLTPAMVFASESPRAQMDHFNHDYVQLSRSDFASGREVDPGAVDKLFLRYFGRYLTSDSFGELDDPVLSPLHSALLRMVSLSHGDLHLRELVAVTQEIYRRRSVLREKGAAPKYAQDTYDVLIESRRFEAAEQLHAALPEQISAFSYGRIIAPDTLSARPAILVLNETGNELTVKPIAVDQGSWFVAVMHTGCPYSRKAMAYIEAHLGEIVPLLPEHTVWVAGQGVTNLIPDLEQWNRGSKLIKIHVAYEDDAWPKGLWLEVTPGFYVLQDGIVVDKVIGWIGDSQAVKLEAMLRKFRSL